MSHPEGWLLSLSKLYLAVNQAQGHCDDAKYANLLHDKKFMLTH